MKRLTILAIAGNILLCVPYTSIAQKQHKSISFKKEVLTNDFISEGVTIADVDKDGKTDVLAGTHWFKAPSWQKMDLAAPLKFKTTIYGNAFLHFALDVNHDGWQDLIRIDFPGKPAWWHENPANKKGHWKQHMIYPSVGNESPAMVDIDGDGRPDLLCNNSNEKKVVWVSSPAKAGDAWTEYVISSDSLLATHQFTHGLGFGDMNNDGRKDVVIRQGWWEAPEDRKQPNWTFHPANLGDDCAQMYIRDVDGDGDQDVLSSSAHKYGIWWHEQIPGKDSTTWKKHDIFTQLAQSHSLSMADIDGDGDEDLITGKRYYAHNGNDPGEDEPAKLYWFEFIAGKEPRWIPHEIDNDSGAGLNTVVEDINNDGFIDIIIGNKKGVFVFYQLRK